MEQKQYLKAVARQMEAEKRPSKQPDRPIVIVDNETRKVIYRERQ